MNFNLKDSLYSNYLDSPARIEIEEKIFTAEKHISILRLLVICLNSFVYIFLLDKTYSKDWMAWPIIALSFAYASYVVITQPYKKQHIYLSSIFTTVSDAVFISLWIYATGGFHSPFYLLWYVSALAIAFRYNMKVTLNVSLIYCMSYAIILLFDNTLKQHMADFVIRIGYLFFFGYIGALMSNEVMEQIGDKFLVKQSREEIRRREQELMEARDMLEIRVVKRTAELHESNKQLVRINDDLDNFVYSASHDLKSPLSNIEALLSMLYEDTPPQNAFQHSIREKLYFSLSRMSKTIGKLGEVAKAQKEIYEDVGNCNLLEILKEVLEENEQLITDVNIRFEFDFKDTSSVYFSRFCIKSILYNLITNSIKYRATNRAPMIYIRMEDFEDHSLLYFTDNGLGIDLVKNGSKIFTIFKRFHDHVEGTGIGLYMVKRMVEKFQGEIKVESKINEGTTFRIKFKSPVTNEFS